MPILSAIRCSKIQTFSQLKAAEAHGKRQDEQSQKRCDPERLKDNLAYSQYQPDQPLELVEAFKAMKEQTGAAQRNGAAIGLHVLAVVSPEFLAAHGDLHDPANPANQKLFKEAQAWAEKEFGKGSCLAARMDMDEKGAGVVDLYLVPTEMQKQRQGSRQKAAGEQQKAKLTISINGALDALQERYGRSRSYEALQDAWANHAKEHISPDIERGRPKKETMREHVHSDILRDEADKLAKERKAARAIIRDALPLTHAVEISEAVLRDEVVLMPVIFVGDVKAKNPTFPKVLLAKKDKETERTERMAENYERSPVVRGIVDLVDELKEKAREIAVEKVRDLKRAVEPMIEHLRQIKQDKPALSENHALPKKKDRGGMER